MVDRECTPLKTSSFFLFGARGVGKSTLLGTLFPEGSALMIDLLLDRDYFQLSENPDSLIDRTGRLGASDQWVVID